MKNTLPYVRPILKTMARARAVNPAPRHQAVKVRPLGIVAGSLILGFTGSAWAQSSGSTADGSWEAKCKAVATADFSAVADAPTQVSEAAPTQPTDGLPGHCRVEGYVTPSVGFRFLLPAENWNGKFLHVGCGGFCGSPPVFATNSVTGCGGALRKGYACIGTDMGHHGAGAPWAYNNLPPEIDFGFRATHVTTLAGKAIAERYYGSAPTRSYFTGCSTGGRQALVAAQRFPWDFDGIVAMDPAINFTEIFMTILWNSLAARDKEGKPVFSEADIDSLHAAIMAKCDRNDGVKDGLIGDPRDCKFDPAELSCTSGAAQSCLSPAQIAAARKIYNGPTTSTGEKIAKGGSMLGSESGSFGMSTYQAGLATFPRDFFRFMAFLPDAGPAWESADFDFDRDYKRLGMTEALYASSNPDLRKFKARGGKLILSQGWHDGGLPFAFNSIDYYETAEKTLGGRVPTQEFFRLFMVPGRDHCAGGDGAWAIDHLSYLEAWVEKGQAPDMLLGHHPRDAKNSAVTFPPAAEDVKFTRPMYPYPIKTKYKGKGDPNKAESFIQAKP